MPLQNLINASATIDAFRAARPGFGKPVIVDDADELPEVSLEVATLAEILDLGFSSSGAVASMFAALTTQETRPRTVLLGRREDAVAQVEAYAFTGTADGPYTVPLNGVDHTFTASGSTSDQIRDGIIAAINGGAQPVTAGNPTAGAFDVTADNAGEPFVAGTPVSPGNVLTSSEDTANYGQFEDMAAIAANDPSGYAWLSSSRLTHEIMEGSRFVEISESLGLGLVGGIFVPQSDESEILDSGSTTDVASRLLALQRTRTMLCYKSNDTHYLDAAWCGKQLPKAPGSTNWAWQPLNDVPPDSFTAAQGNTLEAKRANWIEFIGGQNQAFLGMCSAPGIFVDLVRGRDKVVSDVLLAKVDLLTQADKFDFDDLPIMAARIAGAINRNGLFVNVDKTKVELPEITEDQVSNRQVVGTDNLGIKWRTQIRVPVNKVTSTGVLTISGEA